MCHPIPYATLLFNRTTISNTILKVRYISFHLHVLISSSLRHACNMCKHTILQSNLSYTQFSHHFTSLYFCGPSKTFSAKNFFRCVMVACAEQRINLRFNGANVGHLHSRQMLTWGEKLESNINKGYIVKKIYQSNCTYITLYDPDKIKTKNYTCSSNLW